MNAYAFLGLLLSFTCFLLALISFVYGRLKLHFLMVLFNLYCTVWGIGAFLVGRADTPLAALAGWRLAYSGGMFIGYGFYHLVTVFCGLKRKKFLILIYVQGFIWLFLNFFSDWFISPHLRFAFGSLYYHRATMLFNIFLALWIAIVIVTFLELKKCTFSAKGVMRIQSQYIFYGFLVGFIGGCSTLLPIYKIDISYPYGNFTIVIYSIVLTYAIFKYRLMDIRVAITRTGIFVMVYAFVLGLPLWIGFEYNLWQYATFVMLFLSTPGPLIYNYLRKQVEARLLADDLKKYEALKKFARSIGLVRDLGALTKLIVYRLVKTLKISYGALYLFSEESYTYSLKACYSPGKRKCIGLEDVPADADLINLLSKQHREILWDEIKELMRAKHHPYFNGPKNGHIDFVKAASAMQCLNAFLIIPQFVEEHLIGFLALGEKNSGKHYLDSDIEVLNLLARSASLAILNALYSVNLRKTESALSEAHRAAQLGYLASATGHQISNILNNIAAVAAGLMDNDAIVACLKDTPEASIAFERHVHDIFANIEDGGMIISELRDYAQVEGEKKFSQVNLKEIVDKALKVVSIAQNKFQEIDIAITVSDDVPLVLGSFVQLQNVFINMFNNGCDAILEKVFFLKTDSGLALETYKGKIEVNIVRVKGSIHIHTIDNGRGIPAEVLKRLFTPLYTTKASSEKRNEQKLSGGTGIGLYTILMIIRNHGGSIQVHKTEDLKGTDFLIQLPVHRREG